MPPKLRIRVTRDAPCPGSTLGVVELDLPDDSAGWLPFGYSCEDIDRRVEEDLARKQKGATAIPVGTYAVRLYDSPAHGPDTLELVDVPGFRHIQLHPGNSADDSEGCILIGLGRDLGKGIVTRSRPACAWLRAEAIEAIRAGGTVTVEVRRA